MSPTLPSYTSVLTLGHRFLTGLLDGPVLVQEKVDGSQFSFWMNPDSGAVECRSKGKAGIEGERPAIFKPAIETVYNIAHRLKPGWVYRGEALCKPKHNTLQYARIPNGGVILYDIEPDAAVWADIMTGKVLYSTFLDAQSADLGIECVPSFYWGDPPPLDDLQALLKRESVLGGVPIEGVVIKAVTRLGPDKKPLVGKLVRDDFKEANKQEWSKPTKASICETIGTSLCTEARWLKSIQHLRDDGKLMDAPQDIGPLMKEIEADILKEEREAIAMALFDAQWRDIKHYAIKGFPEWYKQQLAQKAGLP